MLRLRFNIKEKRVILEFVWKIEWKVEERHREYKTLKEEEVARKTMERIVKGFIVVALFYFLVGITLGTAFVTFPGLHSFIDEGPGSLIKWVHGHINLLGWVSMTLFALLYWMVPQLTKKSIYSEGLGWAHFYLANIGLLGMIIISAAGGYIGGKRFVQGVPEEVIYADLTAILLIDLAFTFIFFVANLIFIYNILRSFYPPYPPAQRNK